MSLGSHEERMAGNLKHLYDSDNPVEISEGQLFDELIRKVAAFHNRNLFSQKTNPVRVIKERLTFFHIYDRPYFL